MQNKKNDEAKSLMLFCFCFSFIYLFFPFLLIFSYTYIEYALRFVCCMVYGVVASILLLHMHLNSSESIPATFV